MPNFKITLRPSIDEDINLIKKYFFNQETDYFKGRILHFYKTLDDELVQNPDNATAIVETFFNNIYKTQESKINKVLEQSQVILESKSSVCLNELIKLMDYKRKKSEEFFAVPTLLPFSPFDRPVFYFSIASIFLPNSKNSEILNIAIHEISHFLLFDILEDLNIDFKKTREEQNFFHLFKESLTGMLLSEKEMGELLEKKDYKGNPEVHNLNISVFGQTVSLREHLRFILHQYQEKDLSFSQFIKDVIGQLKPKSKEFSNKKIFWNQNEREIRDGDENLSKEYAAPIVI